MKKTPSVLIILAMVFALFAACGNSPDITSDDPGLSTFGSDVEPSQVEQNEILTPVPVNQTEKPSTTAGVYMPELDADGNLVEGEEAVEASPGVGGSDTGSGTPTNQIGNSNDAPVSPSPEPSPSPSNSGSGTGSGSNPGSGGNGNGNGGGGGSTNGKGSLANALSDVLENHTLPNQASSGTVQYASADVDGDGAADIVVRYTTASGGTSEVICAVSGNKLVVKATSYPGATYYTNGNISTGSSRTNGYSAGKLSPYTMYICNNGSYSESVSVDGWSKELTEPDEEDEEAENPFPDGADLDGNGYIYIVTGYGADGSEYMDDAEYAAWYAGIMNGATKVSVSFSTVTADSVAAMN